MQIEFIKLLEGKNYNPEYINYPTKEVSKHEEKEEWNSAHRNRY